MKKQHTCGQCQAPLEKYADRYCSELCHLRARTTLHGDCWVWAGRTYLNGKTRWAAITHKGVTRKVRTFVADMTGLKATDTHLPDAMCGTPLCCNPDHYALRPRKVAKKGRTP